MAIQSKDPVCGMNIDQNKSQHKTEYKGKQYSFCCSQCMNKFKQNPDQFSSKQ